MGIESKSALMVYALCVPANQALDAAASSSLRGETLVCGSDLSHHTLPGVLVPA